MAVTTLTFKQLQDLVQDQLQEVLAETDMTEAKIRRYINLGYNDFCRRTKTLSDNYDITTVADQESYSLVLGAFMNVQHVRYIEDSTADYGDPLKLFPGGFAGLPKQKEFGIPYYYWTRYHGDNTAIEIGTVPIVSTASVTLRVFGYKLPANQLSLDSSVPLVHEAYHEALILYPVWKMCNAYAHKNRAIREKAQGARNEYLEMIGAVLDDSSSFSMDDVSTVDEYSHYDFL